MYCTVNSCRYADTHNSSGHRCGTCNKYGHGQLECQNGAVTPKVVNIPKDKQCTIHGCQHRSNHTNGGHQCRTCKKYGHAWISCDDINAVAGSVPGKIYITTYAGMGCINVHKRDYPDDPFITFNMHSDAWGQYESWNDVPKLKTFIQGYRPLRDSDFIDI
jgi:hypothetical protein